jgi:predicted DCC family thiol-disulfide oxidoreductase YuxK
VPDLPARLVLYDGVCGVCHHTVQWLIAHDPRGALRYAPLQGPTAAALRARHPAIPQALESVVLVEQAPGSTRVTLRSEAVFRALGSLPAPWRWAAKLRFLPRPVMDAMYRFVARNRYRLVLDHTSCRLLRPEERARFLP